MTLMNRVKFKDVLVVGEEASEEVLVITVAESAAKIIRVMGEMTILKV